MFINLRIIVELIIKLCAYTNKISLKLKLPTNKIMISILSKKRRKQLLLLLLLLLLYTITSYIIKN